MRDIAEVVGRGLKVPVVSVSQYAGAAPDLFLVATVPGYKIAPDAALRAGRATGRRSLRSPFVHCTRQRGIATALLRATIRRLIQREDGLADGAAQE